MQEFVILIVFLIRYDHELLGVIYFTNAVQGNPTVKPFTYQINYKDLNDFMYTSTIFLLATVATK